MADDNDGFDIEKFEKIVAPMIAGLGLAAVAGMLMKGVQILTATNKVESDSTGTREMHPTKADESLEKQEAAGAKQDASGAKDEVEGQHGEVGAAEQDVKANKDDALASEAGASASRVKAGASDIETKAFKKM